MSDYDFELSSYQKDIINYFNENLGKNMMIQARAGSGKTYLNLLLSKDTKTSDLYVAFNNSVAKEFDSKATNPKVKSKTLHSLAYSYMNWNLEQEESGSQGKSGLGTSRNSSSYKSKVNLDNFKIHKVVDDIFNRRYGRNGDFDFRVFLKNSYVQLYNLCRLTLTDFEDEDAVRDLIDDYILFNDTEGFGFGRPDMTEVTAWLKEINLASNALFENVRSIDFTDMLYITYIKIKNREWSVPPWGYYTNIYVDECMPGDTEIIVYDGEKEFPISFSELYEKFCNKEELPLAKSYNVNQEFEYKKIVNVKEKGEQQTYCIKTIEGYSPLEGQINGFLYATGSHKFLTDFGYKELRELSITDVLINIDFADKTHFTPIISISRDKFVQVYDIEVQDNHNYVCVGSSNNYISKGYIVHNCQDLNNLQLQFLKFIKRKNGRYIYTGDDLQAIYSFSGANAHSWQLIKSLYAPLQEFDLPICYRCPTSHLKLVNDTFNIPIKPRPNAPEGFIDNIEQVEIPLYVQPGDMIISRKNKWLPEVILSLAQAGIPIYIEDKELVDSVQKVVKNSKVKNLKTLQSHLQKNLDKQFQNIMNLASFQEDSKDMTLEEREALAEEVASTNSQVDTIQFTLKIISAYLLQHPTASVTVFENYVNNLLNTSPNSQAVRICSIHKAKGLEAENVFVLNEAKWEYRPYASPEQNQQEKNLSYIAMTRAKIGLYLVALPNSPLTQEKNKTKKDSKPKKSTVKEDTNKNVSSKNQREENLITQNAGVKKLMRLSKNK